MVKNIYNLVIIILRKIFYPRHFILFYLKKFFSFNFVIKHFIKKLFSKYTNQHDIRVFWHRKYDINSYTHFQKFRSRELGGEIRNCIKISSKQSYILKKTKVNSNLKLGFYFENSYKNKIKGFISVDENNQKTPVNLSDLTHNYWHEASISSNSKKNFKIINNTDTDLFFSYCKKNSQNKKIKNIIHLVLDSLDMHTLRDGKEKSLMPNTNNFFKKSIVFENCFSSSEWTLPWVCSYLKGEMPSKHRLTDPKTSKRLMDPFKDNIFDLINKKNYSLIGFGPKPIFNPSWNNIQNFDKFYPTDGSFEKKLDLLNVSKKIIEHIEVNNSNNFFYAHLMDTHFPWSNRNSSEEFEMGSTRSCDPYTLYHSRLGQQDTKAEPIFENKTRKQLLRYSSTRLKTVDRNLSFLINFLQNNNLLKNTVFILSSDHGQTFHDGPRHLFNFKKTNVPLMIFHPDYKNIKVDKLVNNSIDLNHFVKKILNNQHKNLLKSMFDTSKTQKEIISESIYGNRYKISIRSEKFTYHLSCFFDREQNIIDTNTTYYENIFNFKETKKYKNKKIISNFRVILKKHLVKNFKGKISWFI